MWVLLSTLAVLCLSAALALHLRLIEVASLKNKNWLADTGVAQSTKKKKNADPRKLGLNEVYTSQAPNIDIVAIHGLDTHSPKTWVAWKNGHDETDGVVHWLRDPDMLPERFPTARIFTYDWNANVDHDAATESLLGHADSLLLQLHIQRNEEASHRHIIFVASCFGGLLLCRALHRASVRGSKYAQILDSTAGVAFLGTPFRGSSDGFLTAAQLRVKVAKSMGGETANELIKYLSKGEEDRKQLDDAVQEFCDLANSSTFRVPTCCFYETRKSATDIGILVEKHSACLDGKDRVALPVRHALMNKFWGPHDIAFDLVSNCLKEFADQAIRTGPDAWIRNEHYIKNKRLEITRLSGDSLPMDQCYINLAIVEMAGQHADRLREGSVAASGPRSSRFSIFARQKVETPDKTSQVDLKEVFIKRTAANGSLICPRRILIRGRTGVGKTTLCKRMVHDFIYHRTWNDLFDRILWVPLRTLKKQSSEGWNLETMFYHEYFWEQEEEGRRLAKILTKTLNSVHVDRTLFILDGLDEVSGIWTRGDTRFRFLLKLLNRPTVIITSRPGGALPANADSIDLELETMGFYPDQVDEYIEKSFVHPETNSTDKSKIDEVSSFLQKHWLVNGLVRIPIQLDALCYVWNDLKLQDIPDTMTGIYREIELKLWKKDVLRLEKKHESEEITEDQIQSAGRRVLEEFVKHEMTFLESLAFTGLHNDIIEFTSEHLEAISNHFTRSLLPDKTLPSLSFLRTSDPSSEYRYRNYHFIHLTFQEYFAALYFVRQWTDPEGQLQFLTLNSKEAEANQSRPAEFLRQHKYSARYDVFWRFVAGLLDSEGKATEFIYSIEEEPLDLLGPTHQRLVMHCLNEVSTKMPLRQRLEEELKLWLLFECSFRQTARLSGEMEFPERALHDALREGPDGAKVAVLQSLQRRPTIPPSVIELAVSWLGGDISHQLKREALKLLETSRIALTNNVFAIVFQTLDGEDSKVRAAAANVLRQQSTLYDEFLIAIIQRLADEDLDVRLSTLEILRKRSSLPDKILTAIVRIEAKDSKTQSLAREILCQQSRLSNEILTAVVQLLGNQIPGVRSSALEVLRKQSSLSNKILMAVVQSLGDDVFNVEKVACWVLEEQSSLSDEILAAVVQLLGHQISNVRWLALEVLQKQPSLSNKILMVVIQRLYDDNSNARKAAMNILKEQSRLSGEILIAVVQLLDEKDLEVIQLRRDDDSDVRKFSREGLQERLSLSDEFLMSVVQLLDDDDSSVRRTVLEALETRLRLSSQILEAIVQRLDGENSIDWNSAAKAVQKRSDLSGEIITAVVKKLYDEDSSVRESALNMLYECSNLSNEIITAVVENLDDEDSDVRKAALRCLEKHSGLPDKILMAVVQRLNDEDFDVQGLANDILEDRPGLSNEILAAVVKRLDDMDSTVQQDALWILRFQSSLSEEILVAIIPRLDDEDSFTRQSVLWVLGHQSSLSNEILTAVAQRLNDEDWEVRSEARDVLKNQSSLSNDVLTAVTQWLEDESSYGQEVALEVIQHQPSLSDEILIAVARLLASESAGDLAEATLRKHEKFYSTLLCGPHMASLFKILLGHAFEEQWSWHTKDGRSCLNMPDGVRNTRIGNRAEFVDSILEAQPLRALIAANRLQHETSGLKD